MRFAILAFILSVGVSVLAAPIGFVGTFPKPYVITPDPIYLPPTYTLNPSKSSKEVNASHAQAVLPTHNPPFTHSPINQSRKKPRRRRLAHGKSKKFNSTTQPSSSCSTTYSSKHSSSSDETS